MMSKKARERKNLWSKVGQLKRRLNWLDLKKKNLETQLINLTSLLFNTHVEFKQTRNPKTGRFAQSNK